MAKLPKANKNLGQHYLKDKSVINKIMGDQPQDYDIVIEVGPGPAIITKYLNELNRPIYLIEFDRRFEDHLQALDQVKNIFFEDALKFSWDDFLDQYNLRNKKIWLVSNLPYNIASQLFISFLQVKEISHMTLMYQKEVGEKTYVRRDSKNQMSSLLALSQCFMDSHLVAKVSPGAFLPPPKVDSIVVGYQRKEFPTIKLKEFKAFEAFIRPLFAQKRKQVGSVLKFFPNHQKLKMMLEEQGFNLTLRAEAMEFDQIIKAYKTYKLLA